MSDNFIYAIEFLRPDGIYSVDLAQRLLSVNEYLEREKKRWREYLQQSASPPLTVAEKIAIAHFFREWASLTPHLWEGWRFYENLEGQHVAVPPCITPTITQLEREAVPDYLECRIESLEDSLGQLRELYEKVRSQEKTTP